MVGSLTLRAFNYGKEHNGIKVTLKIEDGKDFQFQDRILLDTQRNRKKFADSCPESERLCLNTVLLKLHEYLRVKLSASPNGPAEKPSVPEMTLEEQQEAMKLLKDPNLLLNLIADTERFGFVGENENKAYLYLAYTSRRSDSPINTVVKGESSVGKNYTAESIADFIPPEDIIKLSGASAKAFFYTTKTIKHKLILIAERVGSEDSDYSIRTIQSEKQITVWVVQKGEDNQIRTIEKTVEGPAAFVETTTKTHLHPENETRTFEIYIDESEEQTKKIHEAQNRQYTDPLSPDEKEKALKKWHNAQRLLQPCKVLIPFAEQIKFPTKPVRVRRDRPRFMELIGASAFLHQYQRQSVERNGITYSKANVVDYAVARELAVRILKNVLTGATPKCKQLVEKASEFKGDFKRIDLEKSLGWDTKTVNKYAKEAIRLGCLEGVDSGGGKGNFKTYGFIKPIDEVEILLPPEQLLVEEPQS